MSLGPRAVIAQLAARRSHNPKVVSSILTHRSLLGGLHWHGTEPGAARHLQVCPCHGRGREASPRAAYPPPLPAPPLPRSPSLDPAPPLLPVLSPCCFDLPPPPRHTPPTAAHPPTHPPTHPHPALLSRPLHASRPFPAPPPTHRTLCTASTRASSRTRPRPRTPAPRKTGHEDSCECPWDLER